MKNSKILSNEEFLSLNKIIAQSVFSDIKNLAGSDITGN
jgi:hypothetical protein